MPSPKLSLFTPTNNPRYLLEAWHSLQLQDYPNYEWVIVPNGRSPVEIPETIRRHPAVRVVPDTTGSNKIGALKRFACSVCKGDAFIEFDHDDLLVPGTLPKVAQAIADGAGFVYSDSAVFNDSDLVSWGYSPTHGWETEELRVFGKPFLVTKCFPLSPRMLCEVYYAPDHVRCWSRQAYYDAGGHDSGLSVGDDHDLVCRTYLAGAPFKHIGCCGYLYRWHDSNTVKLRNASIQTQQAANRRRYLLGLVGEWCKREKLPTLNLLKLWQAGNWDPKEVLNLEAGKYGQIMANDVLQFVPAELLVHFFNMAYEALVPGGFLHVAVPSENGRYASMNPLHVTRFNVNSFLYYARREFAQNLPGVTCRFDLVQCEEIYPDKNFQAHEMRVIRADLSALKGQRHPGPKLI